jgi:hypothetical protein
MPIYTFIHPDTEEEVDVTQNMKESHVYIDENGLEWKRKWTLPNAQIDADVDPFDKQAFNRRIDASGKGTVGELWDRSRELSEKRKSKLGYDPVQKEYEKKYSKDRMGRELPDSVKNKD